MVTLPIRPILKPAVLDGQSNGKLPASILVDVPCLYGGPTIRLVEPAARCFVAMRAAAAEDGHKLKCSGTYDSYRPYEQQEKVFLARYRPVPYATSVRWNGQYWVKKDPRLATAAVPGRSNHGLALAVDCGEERDGDAGTESLDDATLAWLSANALRFGWSWELVPEEPWHVHCFSGDIIPAAVLAYESTLEDDLTPEEHETQLVAAWRVHAEAHGESPLRADDPHVPESIRGEKNWVVDTLKELVAKVDALATGGVDYAALAKAVNDDAAARLAQ